MRFGIQSWWMAASGALLVGLSAALDPVILWHINEEIQVTTDEIKELESNRQLYMDEKERMDERVVRATQLLTTAYQQDDTLKQLALTRASEDAAAVIFGSLSIFNLISNNPVSIVSCFSNTPDTEELSTLLRAAGVDEHSCFEWYAALQSGDADAFAAVASFRTGMLGVMSVNVQQLSERIRQKQSNIGNLRSNRSIWQGVEIFLALIGLLMLVLKDVPIWKRKNPPQTKGGETGQGGNG